jgi:hypothetical protein
MAKLPPSPMQRVPAERVEFRGLVDRLIADLQEAGKLREKMRIEAADKADLAGSRGRTLDPDERQEEDR